MHTVSVMNYKGGVGKTTVVANLGAELAYRGRKVLLVDLDAQASLTFSFIRPEAWERRLANNKTIKKWYDSFGHGITPLPLESFTVEPGQIKQRLVRSGNKGCLHLVPSHLGLINVDLELATELGAANLRQGKLNYLRVHRRLAEELSRPHFSYYDLVLIDCPPNFNVVTKTAIVASDRVLIPAKADYLSTLGIDYLRRSLAELVRDYNEYAELDTGDGPTQKIDPQILGVIFTMIQYYANQPISAHRQYISQAKQLNLPVFDAYVRENKSYFADAARESVPLVMGGPAPADFIIAEIEAVVSEFEERLGI